LNSLYLIPEEINLEKIPEKPGLPPVEKSKKRVK